MSCSYGENNYKKEVNIGFWPIWLAFLAFEVSTTHGSHQVFLHVCSMHWL
jgi:hypothetical protein